MVGLWRMVGEHFVYLHEIFKAASNATEVYSLRFAYFIVAAVELLYRGELKLTFSAVDDPLLFESGVESHACAQGCRIQCVFTLL